MIIYPAIDLKNGRVVRLQQGDFARETVYSTDPVNQAQQFEAEGAKWLHLVDLDGAQNGKGKNVEEIRQIKAKTGLKLQLGGGIRSIEQMEEWFSEGIDRLVIGTMALVNPTAVSTAVREFGTERIVVSLDAKGGIVATHGWSSESGRDLISLAQEMLKLGITQILYTDISRDGMLAGPDFYNLKQLILLGKESGLRVIASGGVSSYQDLQQLKEIGTDGVIIGQALYLGVVCLPKILEKIG